MSTSDSPLSIAFDVQRQTLQQTSEAVTRSIETHQEFSESFLDFMPVRQANERSYEAVRAVVDNYVDAVRTMLPADQQHHLNDLRAFMNEQIDALEASQGEAIDAAETNAQASAQAIEQSLNTFVTTVEDAEMELTDFHEEFEHHRETLLTEVDATVEEFETQLHDLRQEIEAAAEAQMTDETEAASAESEETNSSLETINGIGPAYAARLREHGIESPDALVTADVEAVATAADVSEKRASEWVDAAGSME